MKSYSGLLAILFAASTLVGCMTPLDRQKVREDTLFAYSDAIRWSQYSRAVSFLDPTTLPPPDRLEFELERLEQVQISGYEVVSQSITKTEVEQLVEIRLYNKHTLAERTVRDRQQWRWDEEEERWYLMSGLPDISRR